MARSFRFNRSVPILSVDLVEDRFRFTSTVTAGAAALDRLARAGQAEARGRADAFGRIVMERAPHLAEQAGRIGTRQLLLDRRRAGIYREPIRVVPG